MMIYCSRTDVLNVDAVLQQMKGSEVCVPVSECAQTHLSVYEGGKATWWSHLRGACSLCEAAEEGAESHPGAGKGKQELTGSMAASAAGPGQGDSLLPVSPASRGCLGNEGAGCAPPSSWTYIISATSLGEHPIPAPLRGPMYTLKYCSVRSEYNFVSESVWVIEIVG